LLLCPDEKMLVSFNNYNYVDGLYFLPRLSPNFKAGQDPSDT